MAAEPSSDPGLLHVVEAGRDVDLIRQQDRHRRSAGNHRLDRVAVAHAAGVVVDQLAAAYTFIGASNTPGRLTCAADAEQLRSAVLLGTERREPLGAARHHERHVAQRLDVVHRGRAAPRAGHGRERRLEARLRALAFERFEQRRLFAGFVGAGAAMQVDLAVEAGAQDVLAEEAGRARVVDRLLQRREQVIELAADVDVGGLRADGVAADQAPLDQQVRDCAPSAGGP